MRGDGIAGGGTRTQLPSPLFQLPHDRLQVAHALVEDVDLVLILVDIGILPPPPPPVSRGPRNREIKIG